MISRVPFDTDSPTIPAFPSAESESYSEPVAYLDMDGGTATDLDFMTTVGVADGVIRDVVPASGVASRWILSTGTAATDWSNGIGRPLDYSATNQRNWTQIG